MAIWRKAEGEAKKEDWLSPDSLAQSGSGVHRAHGKEGRSQCKEKHGPKTHNRACSSLCIEHPDESSGIHLLMIKLGPDDIIFSVVENIALHHSHNMLQANRFKTRMKYAMVRP